MVVTESQIETLNATTQAESDLTRVVWCHLCVGAQMHGRRRSTEDYSVSRSTVKLLIERDQMVHAVPAAIPSSVGGSCTSG